MAEDRTFEQMIAEAFARLNSIRANGEEPGECHFLVSFTEECILRDRPPLNKPEMNMERTHFFGMPIALRLER